MTVNSASIALPFLQCTRTATIQGDPSIKLESYRADAPFKVPGVLTALERPDFTFPSTTAC